MGIKTAGAKHLVRRVKEECCPIEVEGAHVGRGKRRQVELGGLVLAASTSRANSRAGRALASRRPRCRPVVQRVNHWL
jgi:hypothetical protein